MPVNSLHPKYTKYMGQWERCRDVVEGSDAVKAKGTKYLPKLSAQKKADYQAYKKRALFFSAAGRSLQGLVGTMTRRTPTINQEGMDDHFNDTSLHNKSFKELFTDSTEEVLTVGRYGMLADVATSGGRAYIAIYESECILNWRHDDQGNLIMVVLRETLWEPDTQDPFVLTEKIQYRHLFLRNGVYTVEIYAPESNAPNTVNTASTPNTSVPKETYTPTIRGETMNFIPFVCVTPTGLDMEPAKPPILDIVDVNLSQYITSADLENGRHFVALPTPVVTGAESDAPLKVGGTEAWVIGNDKAKAYYLEFQGQGLQSLEKAMAEKTSQMAQFSSRLMDTSTRGSEAAETVRLRHSADSATLSSVAVALEEGFNLVFSYVAMFDGVESPEIELNKDFLDTKLTPAELTALTNSYITGSIDLETYIYNLERGELLPHGKQTMDTEPSPGGGGPDDQGGDEEN